MIRCATRTLSASACARRSRWVDLWRSVRTRELPTLPMTVDELRAMRPSKRRSVAPRGRATKSAVRMATVYAVSLASRSRGWRRAIRWS